MTTTETPQLRRSKRKLAEQAANPVPETTKNNAPVPRKRARTSAIASATESSVTGRNHTSEADAAAMDPVPVQPQQHSPTPSPFLALPRELRDEIYKYVLQQDDSSTLKTGSGKNIITRCGLSRVNSQISEEFFDAVLLYAPVITATVRNHNFAHVVTFLNRLSKAQLTKLSTRGPHAAEAMDQRPKQRRRIKIILSYSAGAKDSRVHLNRWLDRFDAPDKRGKEIEFEYGGDGSYRNGGYKQRPKPRRGRASARWNEEAAKIRRGAISGGGAYGFVSFY